MSKTETAPEKMMSNRAFRGSCANNSPQYARRARDCGLAVDHRTITVGVRLVEVIDEQDENLPEKKRSTRVDRGSCWFYFSQLAQLVAVGSNTPSLRSSSLGFRLVEVIDEQD